MGKPKEKISLRKTRGKKILLGKRAVSLKEIEGRKNLPTLRFNQERSRSNCCGERVEKWRGGEGATASAPETGSQEDCRHFPSAKNHPMFLQDKVIP